MLALATDTPDFMRARNATDILSQVGVAPSYTLTTLTPSQPAPLEPGPSAHRWFASSLDQVQAQRRDGQGHLHHGDRHPRHPPRSADEEHRQPGRSSSTQQKPALAKRSSGCSFILSARVSNRNGTRKKLRRPCLTTSRFWTPRRCRGSVRTRRTSVL